MGIVAKTKLRSSRFEVVSKITCLLSENDEYFFLGYFSFLFGGVAVLGPVQGALQGSGNSVPYGRWTACE